MRITYSSISEYGSNIFYNAFVTFGGFITNPFTFGNEIFVYNRVSGWNTDITGSGFEFDRNGEPLADTITEFMIDGFNAPDILIEEISWGLVDFFNAGDQFVELGNNAPLAALLNSSSSITIDASSASGSFSDGGLSSNRLFGSISDEITVPIHLIGSQFRDTLEGGSGDDYITPGASLQGAKSMARLAMTRSTLATLPI